MGEGPTPLRRFVGFALVAVGALIAVTAGLCTAWGWLALVPGVFRNPTSQVGEFHMQVGNSSDTLGQILVAVGVPAIVGGIPASIGVAVAVAGWRMATRR